MALLIKSICFILLISAVVCQANCQKPVHEQTAKPATRPTGQQLNLPPLRLCRCEELDQCFNEQTTQQHDLDSRCRNECAVAFLPNDTAQQVAQCYTSFEQGKRDKKGNKQQCLENLIGRPCLTDQQQDAAPQKLTLTVDPSKIVQHRQKRNYKIIYPSQLNLYNACVKTCRKNHGIVAFNPDGTPVKGGMKTPKLGNGLAVCATRLNCQIPQQDKKLQKQAKEICKYQQDQVEKLDLKLCSCLETAMNHTFPCVPPSPIDACSTETRRSGIGSSCGGQI